MLLPHMLPPCGSEGVPRRDGECSQLVVCVQEYWLCNHNPATNSSTTAADGVDVTTTQEGSNTCTPVTMQDFPTRRALTGWVSAVTRCLHDAAAATGSADLAAAVAGSGQRRALLLLSCCVLAGGNSSSTAEVWRACCFFATPRCEA